MDMTELFVTLGVIALILFISWYFLGKRETADVIAEYRKLK
jgi:hypothetical protein